MRILVAVMVAGLLGWCARAEEPASASGKETAASPPVLKTAEDIDAALAKLGDIRDLDAKIALLRKLSDAAAQAQLPVKASDLESKIKDIVASRQKALNLGEVSLEDLPDGKPARIANVPARIAVTVKLAATDQRNVYVFVNPMDNEANKDEWWVQGRAYRKGDSLTAICQFGDEHNFQHANQRYAIRVIATDHYFTEGDHPKPFPTELLKSKNTTYATPVSITRVR